jgi:type IV pilus assembly protein PilN
MIRINLAPKKGGGPKTNTGLVELVFYILATAAVAVTMITLQTDMEPQIMQQRNELARLQKDVTQFQDIMPEIDKLQEEQKRAERLKGIIETVQRINKNPVMTLDELARIIPQKVWLISFSEQDSAITMTGMAAGPEEVAGFMVTLQNSDYFKDVRLASVNRLEQTIPELPSFQFVEFTITTRAVRLVGASAAVPEH